MGWKDDKTQGSRHHIVLSVCFRGVIVFWCLSVLHARICRCSLSLCLKQTPVTDMTAILVSSLNCRSIAADESVRGDVPDY